MFLETQPYYVEDFKGGITDFYLDAPPTRANVADNLLIEPYGRGDVGKLVTRAGSNIYGDLYQIPIGAFRVGDLWNFTGIMYNGTTRIDFNTLLIRSKNQIFYTNDEMGTSGWVTIKSIPTFTEVVISITAPSPAAAVIHSDHGFVVGDVFQFSTTGALPAPLLTGTNYFVSTIINHDQFEFSATSGGPSMATVAPGAGTHSVVRPGNHDVFRTTTTESNNIAMARWKEFIFLCSDDERTLPQKLNVQGFGDPILTRNAGLPRLNFQGINRAPGTHNYIYAIFLQAPVVTPTGTTYVDVGPPSFSSVENAEAPNISAINITTDSFANGGSGNNYTAGVVVRYARTTDNGSTYYIIGQGSPGDTFTDNVSDALLIDNELMYTEGGTVDFQELPSSKYIHIVNDIGYYADTTEIVNNLNRTFPSKLCQSIPSIPGSWNPTFFVELKDKIKGISSFRGVPIVICESSAFRIEGTFDELGRGGMFPQQISSECSCIAHNSIVQTDVGIFWAGKNGIFFSDGYKVSRVNDGWPNTYLDLVETETQQRRVQGKLDAFNRRIYWIFQSSGATDTDKIYVLDLNFGVSDDMPFTSLSGPSSNSSFATAIEFDGNIWHRGQHQGYLFTHDPATLSDPLINTSLVATSWIREPIIYVYVSPAYNFGMSFTRYWVPRVIVQCKNVTNLSLQILSNNDDSRITSELKPIKFRGNVTWGDPDVIWGDPDIDWNLSGFIEAQRRFPAKSLRCSFKQIELTNAFIAVTNSDLLGLVTLDSTLNTVTFNTLSSVWPAQAIKYVIAFENDNYTKEFQVITRNSDTVLTFTDPLDEAPANGSYKWVLRGILVNEVFSLQSYTIHYAPLGKTQQAYRGSESGENA